MLATVDQLKKAEFMTRRDREGEVEFTYCLFGTDRRSSREDLDIATDLLGMSADQLRAEGFKVKDGRADLWPCFKEETNEEYTLVVIFVYLRKGGVA